MKKISIFILLITTLLLSQQEEFDLRTFYNKSLDNSPKTPNDFQMQDVLGKMYPQEVIDAGNSQNPENFYDGNVEKEFGPKTTDADDTGAKGIGGYLSIQKSGVLDKLKETTKNTLGGIAKSTSRVNCYITRSQSFFKYHCPINGQNYGFSSTNPTDSPLSAKANCESQCFDPKTTACVLTKPLNKTSNDKEVKQDVFSAIVLSKNQDNQSVDGSFDKNVKVKYFEFKIKNNEPFYLDFSYQDENGYDRVMAKNLLIPASTDSDNSKGDGKEEVKEVQKKFYINSKVSKIHVEFHIGKLIKGEDGNYKYEKVDLNKFADDPKDTSKPQLVIEATKGILFTPETKHFACRSADVSAKRHIFTKTDLTDLVADDGTRITIAKSASSGDNDDGTFSDAEACSATCRERQECTLVQPELNIEEFFGFTEDCSDPKSSSEQCTKQSCIDARENGAPILNETVFDGQGNAIQTIVNGSIVSGVIRPRLLTKYDKKKYEEGIKEEAKDRAYKKMIKDHRYTTSIPIKDKRETSYAVKVKQETQKSPDGKEVTLKNKSIDILVKPGTEFANKKMYLYVMLTTYTTDINYTSTDKKDNINNYKSRFYAMVKNDGKLDFNFFSEKGIQWLDKKSALKIRNENQNAPTFKTYENVSSAIQKENDQLKEGENNKFYIQERLFDDTQNGFNTDTSLCNQYRQLCPAVIRGYLATDSSGANVSTNSTDGKILSGILVDELYINPGKNIPNKKGVVYKAGDIPIQYTISVLASREPLTYKEIRDKLITSEAKPINNENEVYNYLENPQPMITKLKDDSIEPNDEISIYLFGDDKKLSAYASFEVERVDQKQAGYSYYWFGDTKKDDDDRSIISLEPSKKEPLHYYQELPIKETFIPVFENLDISNMKNESLNFGYSSGRYQDDDCRVFKTKSGDKTVCLPWWGIEREYAEHKEPIADNKFQEWIKKYTLPLVGKLVNVCTKIDPFANKIYNSDKDQKVHCTSYYDKNKSEACKTNPYARECFVDTCPAKVKESCELLNTNDFDNELFSLFVKNDITDKDPTNFKREFGDGKVGLKSYTYKCPAHTNTNINQVCLKEDQVQMNPANCNVGTVDADGKPVEGAPNDNDKINLKSNYIYCPTSNPVIDATGNVTGFKGVCPNTKKEVVCGINQVKQVTKTCVAPIFIDESYTEVKSEIKNANCQIYSISVVNGEGDDVYKNDPTCLRDNDVADSRKGILNLFFTNEKIPQTFIVTKNYKDTQDNLYCQYDGAKSPNLPSDCKNANTKGGRFMDFTTIINDSQEIIFAEQIGHLGKGGIDLGFKLNGNGPSGVKTPTNDVFKDESFPFMGSVSSPSRERIAGAYYKKELDFTSQKLTGEIDKRPFTLMPESLNINYNTSKWFEPFFDTKNNSSYSYDSKLSKLSLDNGDKCKCIGGNCDNLKTLGRWSWNIATLGFYNQVNAAIGYNFRCNYSYWAFSSNKVYENSILSLNILLPTPSSYEITFFNKNDEIIHTQTVARTQLTSVPAGTLQTLFFGHKIRTPEQKVIDKEIEAKEQAITREKERIAKLPPIKKVKLSKIEGDSYTKTGKGHSHQDGEYFCKWRYTSWGTSYFTCTRNINHYYVNYNKDATQIQNVKEDNKAFYDRLNSQHPKVEYTIDWVFVSENCDVNNGNYDQWEDDCGYYKEIKTPSKKITTKDGEICVSKFDPSRVNDPDYNVVIDCSPYTSDLEKMETDLDTLKKDLRSKTHNCETDPFSPVGGGTIFGIDSVNGSSCDLDRGEKFITDNAITIIRIVDLETKDITTKKLEFPLIFPNRVFYTYLKAVEDRRYKCCTLLK